MNFVLEWVFVVVTNLSFKCENLEVVLGGSCEIILCLQTPLSLHNLKTISMIIVITDDKVCSQSFLLNPA